MKFYTEHDFSKEVSIYRKDDELLELIKNVDLIQNELSANIHALESKVNYNGLTGLYNRRYLMNSS